MTPSDLPAARTPAPLEGWKKLGHRERSLPGCSLVVATYQRPSEVRRLLDLLVELPDAPCEVVLVDGSRGRETADAAAEWARTVSAPFDLIYVSSPAGLTFQRNVGVDASSGEYVFFLDDDCLPLPGYFASIARVLREDADQTVVAVAGSIINQMGLPVSTKWRLRVKLGLIPACEGLKYYPSGSSGPFSIVAPFTGVRPVDVVPGGASAYRRRVLEKHRFSEYFQGYAQGEDLEMSRRVAREGSLLWCGDAHVRHLHAGGGRPDWYVKGRMEVRNRFFIWKRHSPEARFSDRIRFWMDTFFSVACDAVAFLRTGRRFALRHVFGTARGALDCLVNPPRYQEPAVPAKHDIRLRLVAGGDSVGARPA
jgi:GT2 family glycosyltransferase